MITDGLEYHTIHIISFDPSPPTKTADFGFAIPHPIGGMLNSYPEAPVCIGSVFVGTTHMLNEDHSRQIVVNKLFVNPLGYGSPKDIPGSFAKQLRRLGAAGSVLQVFVAAMPAGFKRRTGCQWALQLSVNSDEFRCFCEMSKMTSKQPPPKKESDT